MRPPASRAASVGLVAPVLLATTAAFADDKAACLAAASKGQTLRDAHQLVEAREQFRLCARSECPPMVQQDCGGWIGDVERSLPTVVLTARDQAGADLVNITVSMDGRPLVTHLNGQAVPTNPGMHVFQFESADGTRVEQAVLVKEGEKNQGVAVVLGLLAAPPPTAVGAAGGPQVALEKPATAEGPGPWRTVGWLLGGVGVAGMGVGTAFGIAAIGDKDAAHCNANGVCQGSLGDLKSAALLSDVGLFGGGVLLVAGATLVLLSPSGARGSAATASIAPAAVASGGGVVLRGSW
jgi:hypothetical protein